MPAALFATHDMHEKTVIRLNRDSMNLLPFHLCKLLRVEQMA
jgi:hypothetical protein